MKYGFEQFALLWRGGIQFDSIGPPPPHQWVGLRPRVRPEVHASAVRFLRRLFEKAAPVQDGNVVESRSLLYCYLNITSSQKSSEAIFYMASDPSLESHLHRGVSLILHMHLVVRHMSHFHHPEGYLPGLGWIPDFMCLTSSNRCIPCVSELRYHTLHHVCGLDMCLLHVSHILVRILFRHVSHETSVSTVN